MLDPSSKNLSRAILHTLAYADLFDSPLTASEIHHYLTGVGAPLEAVIQILEEDRCFVRVGDYFTLPGREQIVSTRIQRGALSRKLMPRAMQYGRILGALPYVRMVALTGSLAVMNVTQAADFDYMLITARGRLWTARAFALALNRFTRLRGYTLCPNLILSEYALEWPIHDLYSARELCQMIPITGFDVYSRLMQANKWVASFLPNAYMEFSSVDPAWRGSFGVTSWRHLLLENLQEHTPSGRPGLQTLLEFPLRGRLGDRLERWEMARKIARFSRQPGFGTETAFNADICQGNFDHHRSWVREALKKRLKQDVIPALGPGASVVGKSTLLAMTRK